MGHTIYRHLISVSHGTQTCRESRMQRFLMSQQVVHILTTGHGRLTTATKSNKFLLTSQQLPKIEKIFSLPQTVFSPPVTRLCWIEYLYSHLHKICGNAGGKDASCGVMDYDTVQAGMWLLNVSEEYTAPVYTVSYRSPNNGHYLTTNTTGSFTNLTSRHRKWRQEMVFEYPRWKYSSMWRRIV